MRYLEPTARVNIPMLGQVPLMQVSALAAGANSVLCDYAHSVILPHILISERLEETESMMLDYGLGAGGHVAAIAMLDQRMLRQLPMSRVAGIGFAAEAIGGACFHKLIQPMMA